MTVDEAPDALGRTLFLPPHDADRADDLKAMLPQFVLPGEARFPARDLPFVHRFNRPDDPDGTTLVLLHGVGGSEADLMPVARRIAPRATLLGVRGRATDAGASRWFDRSGVKAADQVDLRAEAAAFAAFVGGAASGYGLDADRLVFLGYSNGATFLAAVLQLHPGVVRRTVLLRGVQALDDRPATDLSTTRVLVLDGRDDLVVKGSSSLAHDLQACGADVAARELPVGHELSGMDVAEAARWLREINDAE
jgi:phospholipase/carboxylesterase